MNSIEFEPQNVKLADRQQMQRLSIAERRNSFKEIDSGFSEQQAILEAERCFRICGTQGPVDGSRFTVESKKISEKNQGNQP